MRFAITLTANQQRTINYHGNRVYLTEASGDIDISSDVFESQVIAQGQGLLLTKKTFNSFEIKDLTGVDNVLVLEVNRVDDYELIDNRSNVTVGTHPVTQGGADPWTTRDKVSASNVDGSVSVGAASGALVAANAANLFVSIQPQGGDIYIAKGAAATVGSGSMLIKDGQLYECKTTEVINAIRAAGVDVSTYWEAQRN